MDRLIIVARNSAFPTASGSRVDRPARQPVAAPAVVLPRAGAASYPRVDTSPARNWARSAGRAPLSSGMTPDAGASADPGHSTTKGTAHTVLRYPCLSASRPRPSSPLSVAGTPSLIDTLGTIAALLALCCVAMAFLVIA